jgi:hypothetical protein
MLERLVCKLAGEDGGFAGFSPVGDRSRAPGGQRSMRSPSAIGSVLRVSNAVAVSP